VIAIDTNILVYAHRAETPFHSAAKRCVTEQLEGRAAWAIPWPCVHEFLAIVTKPRVFNPPTPLERALEQVEAWLASPSLLLLTEGSGYWPELRALLGAGHVVGAQIHDARIAALCRLHGVRELWTADRDFTRFAGVVVRNPLVADRVREHPPRYGRRRLAHSARSSSRTTV
jgi:toxin-antitoxin system PIN domain toxin